MPQDGAHGVIYPQELKSLEAIFADACRASRIAPGSAEAEDMALKVMLLFQSGIDDHSQLLEAAIKLPDDFADQTAM